MSRTPEKKLHLVSSSFFTVATMQWHALQLRSCCLLL